MNFSIVVTTYNRPKQLEICLASLARLEYPRDQFEVIVVDDGGSTPLDSIVERFPGVRLLRQANGGPASGRNHGAQIARGRYLAFTDDDCEPEPGWLSAFDGRLRQSPDCLVGGHTANGLVGNPYSSASQVIVDVVYAWYNRNPERARFFATNNIALPTDRYKAMGGLDVQMRVASEDREFCDRWLLAGGSMAYEPRAVVVHRHPLDFRSFVRQHFNYGRGAARFHRVCKERGRGGLVTQLGFYTALPSRYLGSAKRVRFSPMEALPLLGVWQGANAVGYLCELVTGRR